MGLSKPLATLLMLEGWFSFSARDVLGEVTDRRIAAAATTWRYNLRVDCDPTRVVMTMFPMVLHGTKQSAMDDLSVLQLFE